MIYSYVCKLYELKIHKLAKIKKRVVAATCFRKEEITMNFQFKNNKHSWKLTIAPIVLLAIIALIANVLYSHII